MSGASLFETEAQAEVEALHAATALYTNEEVVDDLLARAGWPSGTGRLLDPGCGDGAFMVAALRLLAPGPDDVAATDRVVGWELHPGACASARRRYAETLVELGWTSAAAGRAADRNVVETDVLVDASMGELGLTHVVGNPPYLRFAHLPPGLRDLYRRSVPTYAAADMAHAFLDRCAQALGPSGCLAFVTADRWLFNDGAARLRAELGSRFGIAHLGRVDPATAFHRPKRRTAGTPPRVHPVAIVLRRTGSADGLRSFGAEPLPPDGGAPDDHRGRRLGDVATVRLAPWLGPHGIFTVDAAGAATLAGADLVPIVDTDDFDAASGTLRAPTRLAIRTDRKTEPPACVMEHLARTLHRMPSRGRGKVTWMPPETIAIPLDRPSLLIPRIVRQLRPIRLTPGILPINHNLHVVSASEGGASLDEIDGALRTERVADWVSRFAPRLEGGFADLRAGVLRRVPVD